MPIYEYQCSACGNQFEKLMRFSDADSQAPPCPNCESHQTQRQMSRVAAFSVGGSGSSQCAPSSSGFR